MWESYKLEGFVQKFSDCIFNFQERVSLGTSLSQRALCAQLNRNAHIPYVYMYNTCTGNRLIERKLSSPSLFPDFNLLCQVDEVLLYSVQIDGLVGSLETCEYRQATFRELLDQLQKMIDDLNLRSYSNLTQWVSELDKQVWFCHCCTFSVLLPDNYACLFPRNKLEMSFRSFQLVWPYHLCFSVSLLL